MKAVETGHCSNCAQCRKRCLMTEEVTFEKPKMVLIEKDVRSSQNTILNDAPNKEVLT